MVESGKFPTFKCYNIKCLSGVRDHVNSAKFPIFVLLASHVVGVPSSQSQLLIFSGEVTHLHLHQHLCSPADTRQLPATTQLPPS